MTDHDHDRELGNPIELARSFADLVRTLDRLVDVQERQVSRLTETEGVLRGLTVNGILRAGAVTLDASGAMAKPWSFTVPFAAVFVDDPNGLGPLYFANSSEQTPGAYPGVGKWMVQKSSARMIPVEGTELSIAGTGAGLIYVAAFQRAVTPSLG